MDQKVATMTVGELTRLLSAVPPDTKIGFAYPSGDYWRTVLFSPISSLSSASVEYTHYHEAFRILQDGEDCSNGQKIVILK